MPDRGFPVRLFLDVEEKKLHTIKNEYLTACISEKGAELCSLKKADDSEILFQSESDEGWNGSSPLIFPLIGDFGGKPYSYKNENYIMETHGFVSTSCHSVIEHRENSIVFKFSDDRQTIKKYPFQFEFETVYSLNGKSLLMEFYIKNNTRADMLCELGVHTGFRLETLEKALLEFEKSEFKADYVIKSNDERINADKLMDGKELRIYPEFFKKGCITFCGLKSGYCDLTDSDGRKIARINKGNFSELTLWGQPGRPFICVEPWSCESPYYSNSNRLEQQRGISVIPFGKTLYKYCSITVFE